MHTQIEYDFLPYKNRFVPIIPVQIRAKQHNWRQFWAYLDTGATYSIFDKDTADILDIDIFKGKKLFAVVGDGGFMPFYLHKIEIKLERNILHMKIGFSDKLGVSFNLLGLDFLKYFIVTFDVSGEKILLQKN